ncbi:heat shock protein 26 [Drosophila hydei]|uniref:Heat shock protein 26 n=1 Tax=Drosophila hydei TaxID=7224 RepID=A0A6J1LG14_DROHY|nr:heat shock protein 26 [Drosophila hydei]
MSLSQLISLVNELQEPHRPLYDYGLGIHPIQLRQPKTTQQILLNPWQCVHPECPTSAIGKILGSRRSRDMAKPTNGAGDGWHWPVSQVGKDGFQVCMDVTQFTPSELSVKVVDNFIIVEGKHEEREDDHGFISRHFLRRYALPQGYDGDKVVSSLSSDGVLTVSVPKPQPLEDKTKERVIQIQQVGPAHLNVKPNEEEPKDKAATNGNAAK